MQKIVLVALLASATIVSANALASDGTITVSGTVSSQTCVINSGISDFTITLPKVPTAALGSPEKKAGATLFAIALTACSTTSAARAFFASGPNVDTTTGRLNLANGAGSASNLQIGLSRTDGTDIFIGATSGSQNTVYVPIANGTAKLYYIAQYVSTGAAGVGSTTTSVAYTIEYQ